MNKEELAKLPSNNKNVTLCFLVRDQEILLAMKKRGFGEGCWNGIGGKVKWGETPEEAIIRESEEEISVRLLSLHKVAILHFLFPEVGPEERWDQKCHVYLCDKWEGEPKESEEMAPQWFKIEQIPYKQMWSDDPLWLPQVLTGQLLTAKFVFDSNQQPQEYEIVPGLIE